MGPFLQHKKSNYLRRRKLLATSGGIVVQERRDQVWSKD